MTKKEMWEQYKTIGKFNCDKCKKNFSSIEHFTLYEGEYYEVNICKKCFFEEGGDEND